MSTVTVSGPDAAGDWTAVVWPGGSPVRRVRTADEVRDLMREVEADAMQYAVGTLPLPE